MIRKFTAGLVFSVTDVPLKKGILCMNEQDIITDVIATDGNIDNIERLEFFDGIIVPAFIPDMQSVDFPLWQMCFTYPKSHLLKEYQKIAQHLLQFILKHQSTTSFENLLEMVTITAAITLNLERDLGSIEPGKSPGLIQIDNFDFKNIRVTAASNCKILA